jgi:uncharacterized protein YndB with AHSA1/START domain
VTVSQTIIFDTLILHPPQRTLEYLLDDRHIPLYLILSNIMVCDGHPGDIPMSSEEDRG